MPASGRRSADAHGEGGRPAVEVASGCCASAGHCDDRTRVARRSATVPIGTLLSGRERIGLHPLWDAQTGI